MRKIMCLLGLCFSMSTIAQNYDFGKVSKEELSEKFNPLDSSASATYLYKYRKTYFEYKEDKGFVLVTDIHERVKIYNKEGFEYATKIVGLNKNGSDKEEVNSLKAYTYNLVDGKIEDSKLEKDGIFNTEENMYYDQTKFTMPNIKEGCIVEYRYKVYSPFTTNVDDFIFQYDIPVKKLESTFEAPEYFNFKLNMMGYYHIQSKTETKNDKITFRSKTRSDPRSFKTSSTSFNSSDVEFIKQVTNYELKNIAALKEEPYVNSMNNYKSAVKYELSYTDFPNSTIKYYSTTWEDVVKTIYSSSSFGVELEKTGYYEADIDALMGSISDPTKRTALIFDFVKSKVKWNGYYGKYTNDGVKKAFKEQVGNAAEINLMLTSMLKYAGLNAYPVLVSTRKNGFPLFPTRDGYNYVVSYVKLPTGTVLLDATSKYSMPNVLPFRALNWQGRVVAEKGGSETIDLYPKEASRDNILLFVNLDENGTINGGYRSVKTNHAALDFRETYNESDKDDFIEKLENKYKGLEISDFEVKNENDLAESVWESYKFEKQNQADIIGDKIYFSPLFYLRTTINPFKLEKREYPVDFGYPATTSYKIIINLPEGYRVESAPKPDAVALPDDLGIFKYHIEVTNKVISLSIESSISEPIISPIYYETLKLYFKQLVEKQAEQIVLTKE